MTKLARSLAVTIIGTLLLPRVLLARWDSKDDNKPESTLEAMTDKDLVNEAFDVCLRRAMVERQENDAPEIMTGITTDASDYLGVIDQVAGKTHGGIAPSWMLELTAAHTVKKCQAAFRTYLATQESVQPSEEKKVARRVAKKTVPAHRGDPLEQLPPWLAPPHPTPSQ